MYISAQNLPNQSKRCKIFLLQAINHRFRIDRVLTWRSFFTCLAISPKSKPSLEYVMDGLKYSCHYILQFFKYDRGAVSILNPVLWIRTDENDLLMSGWKIDFFAHIFQESLTFYLGISLQSGVYYTLKGFYFILLSKHSKDTKTSNTPKKHQRH